MESKNDNNQESVLSNPNSHPQNQKGKKRTYKSTNAKKTLDEQLFPIQVIIQLSFMKTAVASILPIFFLLNYKTELSWQHNRQLLLRLPYCRRLYTHGHNNVHH